MRWLAAGVVVVLAVAIGLGVGLSGGRGHRVVPRPTAKATEPVVPKVKPTTTASPFLGQQGRNLTLNGEWFRFTGTDNFVMLGCGTDAQQLSTLQAQDGYFAGLRAHSVTRIWVFAGTDLTRLDGLLAAAARHGQYVLPTLADGMGGCGESVKDGQWLREGYKTEYLNWIRTVVPRYQANPTVAMWDLINEPPRVDIESLRAFVDVAGSLVHSLDRHHLVTVGTNLPTSYQGTPGYQRIFSSPQIDAVSLHEYDQIPAVSHHLAEVLAVAKAVDKPVIVGEFGVFANPGGDPHSKSSNGAPCISFAARANLVKAKLAAYLHYPGVAGALYWSFTAAHHTQCALETFSGDSLMSRLNEADLYPGVARLPS